MQLSSELLASRSEHSNALSRIAALEAQVASLERSAATHAVRERELEGKHLELEAQLAGACMDMFTWHGHMAWTHGIDTWHGHTVAWHGGWFMAT